MQCFTCKTLSLSMVMACSIVVCSALFAASPPSSFAIKIRRRNTGDAEIVDDIARRNGFRNLGKIGNLEDMYLFQLKDSEPRHFTRWQDDGNTVRPQSTRQDQLLAEENVECVMDQRIQQRVPRSFYTPPSDPRWGSQWSLLNRGQVGGSHDLNVEPAWIQGFTGKGVTVAVTDDGLWCTHPDLTSNFVSLNDISSIQISASMQHAIISEIQRSQVSWDFVDNDDDVMPQRRRDNHGTSCAGVVAMAKSNGKCGVGVAYESWIAGLRILDGGETTDAREASALGFNTESIDIYSSSWGPYDSGFIADGPGPLLTDTFQRGAKEGRGGKGTIYVWAAGNGGMDGDTCAMDGYVSSIYTIAVGSVDQHGVQAPYDEDCSSKLAVTFNHNAHNRKKHVVTTDVRDKCRRNFKGSSASCPLLSGVIALVLEANNNLTWRDVQYLIVHTSRHRGLTSLRGPQWAQNGAGLWVSHSFGYGAIDAEAMVTRARHWINVPEQKQTTYEPDFGVGIANVNKTLQVSFVVENDSEIHSLEHVVVSISLSVENYTVSHTLAEYYVMQNLFGTYFEQTDINNLLEHTGARRGDITISLISPHNTESILLPYRERDFVNTDTLKWSYMSVLHWGENPHGEWSVVVNFKSSEGYVQLSGLNVTFYGISETSVPSVSENCSPQCNGKCAENGSDYCDVCKNYRDVKTLACMDFCDDRLYEQYRNYCIPLLSNSTLSLATPISTDLYTLTSEPIIATPTVVYSRTVASASRLITSRHRLETDLISPSQTLASTIIPSSSTSFVKGRPSTATTVDPAGNEELDVSQLPSNDITQLPTSAQSTNSSRTSVSSNKKVACEMVTSLVPGPAVRVSITPNPSPGSPAHSVVVSADWQASNASKSPDTLSTHVFTLSVLTTLTLLFPIISPL